MFRHENSPRASGTSDDLSLWAMAAQNSHAPASVPVQAEGPSAASSNTYGGTPGPQGSGGGESVPCV